MAELSCLELRKAVAEKLGWTEVVQRASISGQPLIGKSPDRGWTVVPEYEVALNAVFREVVPVIIESATYQLNLSCYIRSYRARITKLTPDLYDTSEGYSVENLAEAICLAFLRM